MNNAQLKAVAASLETKAGASTTANEGREGYWKRIALAAEDIANITNPANESVEGWALRAALALESTASTTGAEENMTLEGFIKRMTDALEVKAGAVGTTDMYSRLTTAAANAVFSPPFSPASVTPAIWFDPSDLDTLYTDAGATKVTADGQAVYRMMNKGSLGGYLEQATLANRPLWKTGGFLQFSGSPQRLSSAATLDLSASAHLGVAYGFIPRSSTISDPAVFGNTNTTDGSFTIRQQAAVTANVGMIAFTSAAELLQTNTGTFGIGTSMVVAVSDFDITQAAAASKMPFRVNATTPTKSVGSDTGGAGTTFGNHALNLGFNPGSATYAIHDFYGLIVKPSAFAGGELASIETWLGAKLGLTI